MEWGCFRLTPQYVFRGLRAPTRSASPDEAVGKEDYRSRDDSIPQNSSLSNRSDLQAKKSADSPPECLPGLWVIVSLHAWSLLVNSRVAKSSHDESNEVF